MIFSMLLEDVYPVRTPHTNNNNNDNNNSNNFISVFF